MCWMLTGSSDTLNFRDLLASGEYPSNSGILSLFREPNINCDRQCALDLASVSVSAQSRPDISDDTFTVISHNYTMHHKLL